MPSLRTVTPIKREEEGAAAAEARVEEIFFCEYGMTNKLNPFYHDRPNRPRTGGWSGPIYPSKIT
ncbi:hypothetical protein ACJIZ3_023539 [Penstemon smallii]|uniref:Uncharacterized protein n=1 Tax=Penstemon smallii TaxID=265156 RepID=A0ABD3TRU3_9LAMI